VYEPAFEWQWASTFNRASVAARDTGIGGIGSAKEVNDKAACRPLVCALFYGLLGSGWTHRWPLIMGTAGGEHQDCGIEDNRATAHESGIDLR